jgi:hypothetical protein
MPARSSDRELPGLHGVVSRQELLADGLGRGAIAHRLTNGRLFTKYDGVYAIGRPDLSVLGERRAIVLACGEGAVLSHRSAAEAWGLRAGGGSTWEVIVPSDRRPDAPIRTYRYRLCPDEITDVDGIPTTTVARTLLDLASIVPAHQLRRAAEQADQLGHFDLTEIQDLLEAYPRRPGRRQLLTLVADLKDHGVTRTRSDIEAAFLQLCLDHNIPRPEVNRYDNGRERDFTWRAQRLVVEVDGWTYHHTRAAFANDRRRDRAALADGYRVARFTATEILSAPAAVATELRTLLA